MQKHKNVLSAQILDAFHSYSTPVESKKGFDVLTKVVYTTAAVAYIGHVQRKLKHLLMKKVDHCRWTDKPIVTFRVVCM